MSTTFKKDTIVVSQRIAKSACGKILIHEGSIACIVDGHIGYDGHILVFKSRERKESYIVTSVPIVVLRTGNEDEIKAFYDGKRNISGL